MRITQAVIPAAGLGTRFLPLTKVVPKELLPLGNKPAIAWIVDECLGAGIREICFILSRGKELIPQFFKRDQELEEELKKRGREEALKELLRYDEVSFHTVYQEEQLGDGHAVLQAKEWIRSDSFAVLFPDDLILAEKGCLQQMIEQNQEGIMFALLDINKEDVSRYGVVGVKSSDDQLKVVMELIEKPDPEDAPSTLAVMGRFLLQQSTLEVLQRGHSSSGEERRIVDAVKAQIGRVPVHGYLFDGKRFDLGTPEGYVYAVALCGKRHVQTHTEATGTRLHR
jgi:UTP--glucose-1-phosphate uridylyltransferase